MAREVTHEEREPAFYDESDLGDDGRIAICQCGLSGAFPICDGSHRETRDEAEDVRYKYERDDADGERRKIERIVFAEEE